MQSYKIINDEKTQYCSEKCEKIIKFFFDFDDISSPTNISPEKITNSCREFCLKTKTLQPTLNSEPYKKPATLAEEMGIIIGEEYNSTKTNQKQKD